mmetsp:Transcript_1575/g.3196  ORF Transcript_1575/g.3196 Transcript_1575/m.3196 type:complete len:370 (-) Transcript_1575:473-1582(-)
MGPKTAPNGGFTAQLIQPVVGDDGKKEASIDVLSDSDEPKLDEKGASEGSVPTITPDEAAYFAFASLAPSLTKKDFPMNADKLTSLLVKHALPGQMVDFKATAFKKVGKFLADLKKRGVVKTKDQKGIVLLVGVDLLSPQFKTLLQSLNEARKSLAALDDGKKEKDGGLESPKELKIEEVFRFPPSLATVFGTDAVLPLTSLEDIVTKWCTDQGLFVDEGITVNDELCQLFFKKVPADKKKDVGELTSRDVLLERVREKLQQYHKVIAPGKKEEIRKGLPTAVSIVQEERQGGRKHVTKVQGMESFGIAGDDLAKIAQVRFNASASVTALPSKHASGVEVSIQGAVADNLRKYLVEEMKLPPAMIKVKM